MRAGGRSSGSPGPREEAGPGSDIGLWAPVLLLLCWCLEEEEGVPAAPSPPPYNLANSDPEIKMSNDLLRDPSISQQVVFCPNIIWICSDSEKSHQKKAGEMWQKNLKLHVAEFTTYEGCLKKPRTK